MNKLANLAVVGAVISWGFGNVLIKALPDGPLTLSFYRMWIALLILFVVIRVKQKSISMGVLRGGFGPGVAFGLNSAALFTALKLTSVANVAFIVALQPIPVLVLGSRRFGETIRRPDVVLIGTALAGVFWLIFASERGGIQSAVGDVIAVGGLVTSSWYLLATKRARQDLSGLDLTFAVALYSAVIGSIFLFVANEPLLLRGGFSLLGVILLAVFPFGGHLALNWAHLYTSMTVVAVLTVGTPVVSAVLAWMILGEGMSWTQFLSMVVVVLALGGVLWRSSQYLSAGRQTEA